MARKAVDFTEAALSQYATQIHHAWIGDHVDAVIGQTLTKRAFQAVNRMALGQAKKVRFKGKRGLHQIGSLEGGSLTKRACAGARTPCIGDPSFCR